MNKSLIKGEQVLQSMELLQVKYWMTPNPYFITQGETLKKVAEKMDELRIDSLPIVDKNKHLLGMITLRKLLYLLLHGSDGESLVQSTLTRNFASISPVDSILDVFALPYDQLPVLDENGVLVGILTRRDILDGFSKYIYRLEQRQNSAEALNIILDSAYEGIAFVDENGILQEFNNAYSRFTGIKREDAIGRHVTEVIDNTNLHITVKTGIPERGVLQNIQGQDMVVHRIPIWKDGRVRGAIGMLIFEGVTEVYKIHERLQEDHRKERAQKESLTLIKEGDSRITIDQIIGTSEEVLNVKRIARRAARTAATVLITGESGTGKEMFAKSIHHLSPFSTGPFISVNCGAIPEQLFESELFGYEEGAFTGAKKGGKPGRFELAQNGTIFLDELGEMPLMMQTKLLRVLQEREVERVGGVKRYHINARIIGATNRDLKEMVEKGTFREDLFYRINIIQLHIPPLRERKNDIPSLISYYLKEVCEKYDVPYKSLTSEAVSAFMNYPWKGNIREMVNTIERLVTLVEGETIDVQHLSKIFVNEIALEKHVEQSLTGAGTFLREAKMLGDKREKELILNALTRAGGNKSKTAEILGIHRTTLYQKLKKHGIN